jgi:mono/diheme cytochrome c family protein
MDKERSKNRESPDKKSGKWFGLAAAAAISVGFAAFIMYINPKSSQARVESYPVLSKQEMIRVGKQIYDQRCSGCHGIDGKGDGPAAQFFRVKPRDFTTCLYKFKSTPGTSLPTDSDLLRVLKNGVPSTAMPAFPHYSDQELMDVIEYIKTFCPDWDKLKAQSQPPPENWEALKPPPFLGTPDSIAKGKVLFEQNCAACHGINGQGDGPAALSIHDPSAECQKWQGNTCVERPLERPANLTLGILPGVYDVNEIYKTITMGVLAGSTGGMPAFSSLSSNDRWNLVSYVLFLMGKTQK